MARTKPLAKKSVHPKASTVATDAVAIPKPATTTAQPKTERTGPKKGNKALREIQECQLSTNLIIPKAAFKLVVCEMFTTVNAELAIDESAVSAMQESAEAYITEMFDRAQRTAVHADRVTITTEDMHLQSSVQEPV